LNDIELGFAFLATMSADSLISVFWYTLLFEIPRYILPFIVTGLTLRSRGADWLPRRPARAGQGRGQCDLGRPQRGGRAGSLCAFTQSSHTPTSDRDRQ
jgi:hypothetical protein